MRDLNLREKRLLRYPPSITTWQCSSCLSPNTGLAEACWNCCTPKTPTAKPLYPDYLKACDKIGHEPGTPWPVKTEGESQGASTEDQKPARKIRRKGAGS